MNGEEDEGNTNVPKVKSPSREMWKVLHLKKLKIYRRVKQQTSFSINPIKARRENTADSKSRFLPGIWTQRNLVADLFNLISPWCGVLSQFLSLGSVSKRQQTPNLVAECTRNSVRADFKQISVEEHATWLRLYAKLLCCLLRRNFVRSSPATYLPDCELQKS